MDSIECQRIALEVAEDAIKTWLNRNADLDPYGVYIEEDQAQVYAAIHTLVERLTTEHRMLSGIQKIFHSEQI